MCDICSNLTVKIPERRSPDSLLLILNRFHTLLWCLYCLRMQMPSLFLAWSFSSLYSTLTWRDNKTKSCKIICKVNSWSFINRLTPITWRWNVFGCQKLHTVKYAPFSLISTGRLKNLYSVKKAGVVVSGIWLNAQKLFTVLQLQKQRCSQEKVLWKYAANLQQNIANLLHIFRTKLVKLVLRLHYNL